MSAAERRDHLLRIVRRDGYLNVTEVAARLDVDPSSVRRDLHYLERIGLIERNHGGAVPVRDEQDLPQGQKLQTRVDEKVAIGHAIAELIPDGSTVILDAGSTCLMVARALRARSGLTVVTSDVKMAAEIIDASNARLLVPGGEPVSGTSTLVSQDALALVQRLHVDITVISSDAVDGQGPSNLNNAVIPLKRAMMGAATEKILAADSSKLTQRKLFPIAQLDEFSRLVTDWSASDDQLKDITIPVTRADPVDADLIAAFNNNDHGGRQ